MQSKPVPTSAGRVLVVDDVEANRELVAQDLEDEGFDVELASDGEACLSLAVSWRPEVILLDIQMPKMDGMAVCRRLKEMPETRGIPVLFLTAARTDEESVVEALSSGGNDFLPKPYSPAILFARVASQVAISRAHAELERLAMVDSLTGVYSRRHLFDSLHRIARESSRDGTTNLGCLLIDVDHFKVVNDEKGHLEGDRVLQHIAQTVDEATRTTDVVGRFGGEEFVVILPGTDLAGTLQVGESVRRAVEQTCAPSTVSIGASAVDFTMIDAVRSDAEAEAVVREVLTRADANVYRAKRAGRNRVVGAEAK